MSMWRNTATQLKTHREDKCQRGRNTATQLKRHREDNKCQCGEIRQHSLKHIEKISVNLVELATQLKRYRDDEFKCDSILVISC